MKRSLFQLSSLFVLFGVLLGAGCIITREPVYEPGGARSPSTIGVHFAAGDGENMDDTLVNEIRPAVLDALQKGFLRVVEIPSAPPYDAEALKENDLRGVVSLELESVKKRVPLLLQIEGYRVVYECPFSIYDSGGVLVEDGRIQGYAKEATLVITTLNDKAKLKKLSGKAARDAAAELLVRTYERLGR